ncbi:MAG TPA: hypothetical protein PKH98_02905, partial [Candidatus Omnitrophota bacterium]|nr:hypothetical protein [Candidatus Omnitrophota bacterium]
MLRMFHKAIKVFFVVLIATFILYPQGFCSKILAKEEPVISLDVKKSSEYVKLAWEASAQGRLNDLNQLVAECLSLYGNEATLQQELLTHFPPRGTEEQYQSLNDVATILFV